MSRRIRLAVADCTFAEVRTMTPTRRYSPVEWCGLAVAAAVAALGATIAISWVAELGGLLQIAASAPPRFNTAVLLGLCGFSLACSILGHRKSAEGLAAGAALLALLGLLHAYQLLDVDVENLLFQPSDRLIERVGRGSVALGSNVCAVAFGLSIWLRQRFKQGAAIALPLGIVICLISWVALNQRFMGAGANSSWPVANGIAVLTAIALLLLGAVTIARACEYLRSANSSYWLSTSIALGMAAASFMIWRELVENESRHLRRETAAASESIRLEVQERLQDRAKAVDRLTLRWSTHDHEARIADAQRLMEDFDGILAMYGVSPDYRVIWVCGPDDALRFLGKTLPPGPRQDAVRQACQTGRFTFTPVVQLNINEPGFIGFAPTYDSDGQTDGCIAAIFLLEPFLEAIAQDRRHVGFEFAVYEANRNAFASTELLPTEPCLAVTTKLDFRGLNWQFVAWPDTLTVAGHYTHAPSLVFATGMLSAMLVGLVIQLRQRAMQRTTEAMRSAEALHFSEQRFDLAVHASRDGIWEWRAGADGYYASPHYREMLGYPFDDAPLSEQTWFARMHPDDLPHVRQAIEDHFQRGATYDVVVRFFNFRNEWVWLRVRGQCACDENGQPIRMAGSIADITEEREAQQTLLRHVETIAASNKALAELAEAAEAAAAAKSTFLRTMSHELRTPLNAIIGFSTGLLRHTRTHGLDAHQRDRIERIAASGQHLLALVNNVLDIAKAEAAEHTVQPEAIDLTDLFDEVISMTEPLLQRKPDVQLLVESVVGLPAPVLDRARLKQILLNLLGNAAKFTDHGTITLSAAYQTNDWRFTVADTGIGISPADQRRVFENFEQVHSAGRNVEGTGLGLAISAAMANAMRGTITLTSQLGVGSQFTLVVPQPAASRAEPTASVGTFPAIVDSPPLDPPATRPRRAFSRAPTRPAG
ncbi:Virulence sensor protein BvgS precursor [Lacipirellula limnantheis]|uniref:histidine kinase n=2 Tax=Lacipirellula limnantheis TaxID=2528024 RepID=A0A517U4B8_9BACT|nr:Virulence sensor protein BvgS precursor [Lacipirellula limnantheis]